MTEKTLRSVLRQTDPPPLQRDLARALAQEFLDHYHDDKALHDLGVEMVSALWPENDDHVQTDMQAVQQKIAALHEEDDRTKAAGLFAKLGHLHQMAGLLLRQHQLSIVQKGDSTLGSFLNGNIGKGGTLAHFLTSQQAVAALAKPRIELTFTAHPTNTNSLSNMHAQRQLANCLSDIIDGKNLRDDDLRQAFAAFKNAPLLPENTKGAHRFSVRDETQHMLHHLNCAYEDLPRVYGTFDKALKEKFPSSFDPAAFTLNLGFHSWGSSGDKDGNQNVHGDSTLYALAMHYQYALLKYSESLKTLPKGMLDAWKQIIGDACVNVCDITKAMEERLNERQFLSEDEHNRFRENLQSALKKLDKTAFSRALNAGYDQAITPECKQTILDVSRGFSAFGFSFGQIEYRETSEEITRILEAALDGYKDADEQTRQAMLNTLLSNREDMAALQGTLQALSKKGKAKPYEKENAAPITYHTMKRLELARDFPAAFENHVLAECSKTSHVLELLVLQHAAKGEASQRPVLNIIPLFEDRDPVKGAPAMVDALLKNDHYRQHMQAAARKDGLRKPRLQVQLAHSDNARRNGLPAARALIYEAHDRLRETVKEHPNVTLQFYEGGSLTDSFRGGTRAVSASINQFGIHDFTKLTVQGGDLLNLFNLGHSMERFFVRNVAHSAARLWAQPTVRANETAITQAIASTSDDYKQMFEGSGKDAFNDFLTAIGFAEESGMGNIGSRPVRRSSGEAVDATKVRTISYSEGCQHSGLNPSWIGAKTLPEALEAADIKTPAEWKKLYDSDSPLFKDVIDRMLFGLVRTDMDYLRERSGNHAMIDDRFQAEYDKAFKLCMEAYTGKKLSELTPNGLPTQRDKHQFLVGEVYAHLRDVFDDHDRYTTIARNMKRAWNDAEDPANATRNVTLHNALDTVIHGRLPLIEDPTYATLYCNTRGITRPHVTLQRGAPVPAR